MQVSLFDRIGGEAAIQKLVDAHLAILRSDPANQELCGFYCQGFDHYRTRMCEYLTGFLGGPAVYMQNHGIPHLREKHQKLFITPQMRDLWYGCMTHALEQEVPDEELRRELAAVFWSAADGLCNS